MMLIKCSGLLSDINPTFTERRRYSGGVERGGMAIKTFVILPPDREEISICFTFRSSATRKSEKKFPFAASKRECVWNLAGIFMSTRGIKKWEKFRLHKKLNFLPSERICFQWQHMENLISTEDAEELSSTTRIARALRGGDFNFQLPRKPRENLQAQECYE